MANIKPFKGYSPAPQYAEKVASPPYDVLSSEEARKMGEGNPKTFLRVVKSEIDFPKGTDLHSDIIYKKGKYYDARDDRAGKENESNIIIGEANAANISFPIGIRQVSGAIARRIVCATQISDSLKKGEKYGMIKFGSRTEVYLPYNDEIKISVNVGDKITAGTSIIAEIVK